VPSGSFDLTKRGREVLGVKIIFLEGKDIKTRLFNINLTTVSR